MTGKLVNPSVIYAQIGVENQLPLLTREQKELLADSGTPFNIVAVEDGLQGEKGEFWAFTVEANNIRFRFGMGDPLSSNKPADVVERVTAEYNAIKATTENGDMAGPYTLERIEWKGGLPFYKLSPAFAIPALTEVPQEALPF